MKTRFKLLLALVSGVLMGCTAAPLEAWYLAWVAVVPLWFLFHSHQLSSHQSPVKQSPVRHVGKFLNRYGESLWVAIAWGLGYQGLTLFWITGIHPMTWMGVPWFWSLCIAAICWIIITLWGMGIPLVWGVGMALFHQLFSPGKPSFFYRLNRVIFGTALWCSVEYFWSQGDLFWHFLAFSQSPHNLALLQLVRLSGFTTVTAIILLVNSLIAEGLLAFSEHRKRQYLKSFLGLSLGIFVIAHLSGWLWLQRINIQSPQSAEIGIIQGNIPNDVKLYTDGTRRAIANYTRGYRELAQKDVDLVVTPETALPFQIEDVIGWTEVYRQVLSQKIPIVLGAFGSEGKNFTNSLFTLGSRGEILSRYNKQQLVPLGEYIPFEAVLGKFIDRLSPLDAHLVRGENPPVLQTPIGKATAAICYESAYPEHFRRQTAAGGEFIIVSSNDAHYSATMPAQHHALDTMQAIANDRWVIRATNTGYSGIITPTGETRWKSALEEYRTHSETIYLRQGKTPYVRWGNWFAKLCLLVVFGNALYILNLRKSFLKPFF